MCEALDFADKEAGERGGVAEREERSELGESRLMERIEEERAADRRIGASVLGEEGREALAGSVCLGDLLSSLLDE